MNVDETLIETIVKRIKDEMEINKEGIFDTMDEAIEASDVAFQKFTQVSMRERETYIKALRQVILKDENLRLLSKMAVDETKMGNYEHKFLKNKIAALKTPGTEDLVTTALSGDGGLTLEEYCPYGVIGAITPTTNPTETIINNSIGMIAAGNTVVFSPHPRSKQVSLRLIKMLNQALREVGAPENLIVSVKEPSIKGTEVLMKHPKVKLLVATGGPGIVNAVMSSGKKAIGAGAGNPPVVVDETADINKAADWIVKGCSFDHNLPCIAEKEVIVVEKVANEFITKIQQYGAFLLNDQEEITRLQNLVFGEGNKPNVNFVGKSARYILESIGILTDVDVKVIVFEANQNSPFVLHELMMPILPIVQVPNVDDAIELAVKVEHGYRHTAIMHSKNVDNLSKMARCLQTTIFVKNAPSYAGIGVDSEGSTTFTIAGPTGEGITTARSFCRKRRCVLFESFHIR